MRLMNLRRPVLAGLVVAGLSGCASAPKAKDTPPATELEIAYDDGQPAERPLLPPPAFEWLVKFEPNLPAYRPLRLRFLLSQPGPLRLVLYAADAAGRPGLPLYTVERAYAPELASGGKDGKWLLEPLGELPVQTGPLFVGISVPAPGNDAARLWTAVPSPAAASTPHVFQRDAEPGTALQSSSLALTPLLRLALTPAAVPASAASTPAATPAPAAPAPQAPAPPAPAPAADSQPPQP